jgi:integrase/recombinase XerD
MSSSKTFPALIQSFFTERLLTQRRSSAHTISGYRDSFRLLLSFATQRTGKSPADMALSDLDAPLINQFLDHLEVDRGNSVRTRNLRLAAIHSFYRYVSSNEPAWALVCQRVLAIPSKRWERNIVGFLEQDEIDALLEAPDISTWLGRRDRALLLTAVQTGLRVSELVDLHVEDVTLGKGAHVRCRGKGRKERCAPLRKDAVSVLGAWLKERQGEPTDPPLPIHTTRPTQSRCRGAHCYQTLGGGREAVPSHQEEDCDTAYAETQQRHGSPAARRRLYRHRPLARARGRGDHPDLPAR